MTRLEILSVGDKVRISEDSDFSRQLREANYEPGIIISVTGSWYLIEFPNGYRNSYRVRDLELVVVPINNNKEAIRLLDKEW